MIVVMSEMNSLILCSLLTATAEELLDSGSMGAVD